MIHKLADVTTKNIGKSTYVWQYTIILSGARIGENCNINAHCFIENDVTLGDNVTVKCGVYLWDGITISDNVFIGPNVTFTNDKRPRSKERPLSFEKTLIENNVSIGAGSTILSDIKIGEFSMIGAYSLVTKDVPKRALVYGNPARIQGWLNNDGSKMKHLGDGNYEDIEGVVWKVIKNQLVCI